MNQTLRDAFARELDAAGRVDVDVDVAGLVDQGETRLRHRRLAALAGSVAAVVLVVAATVGVIAGHSVNRGDGPVNHPPHHVKPPSPAREIVYAEHKEGVVPGHTVHFGDRVVESGNNHVHLDVTDDGFVYTDRGGVWFSDGGTPVRVGTPGCPGSSNGAFGNYANRVVMTANSGSTAAWFDCTHPARPTLVVFDTSALHEVARHPLTSLTSLPPCVRAGCGLVDVTSDSVYLGSMGGPVPAYKFDVRTNRLGASTPQEYAEDLRSHPRALILGDDWQSGTPITSDGRTLAEGGGLRFDAVGSRLVPVVWFDSDHHHMTSAFDTATQRVLHLRLPAGYHAETGDSFGLFEWLDDDTIALIGGRADILTCQLSTGRCVLAVPGPNAGTVRLVPTFPLPG